MTPSRAFERIVLTLWVGSLWTVGFIVAPALFAWFDNRAAAGNLAGQMLTLEAWLSLGFGALLAILYFIRARKHEDNRTPLNVVLAMIALIVVGEWLIHPRVTASRIDPGALFAALHTLSMLVYAAVAVLGMLLVVRQR